MTLSTWVLSWCNPFSYTILEAVLFWPIVLLCLSALLLFIQTLLTRKTSYKGKNVIITGGSQGIGLEMALLLGREGANICLLARDPKKLGDAVEQVRAAGVYDKNQKVSFVPVDVADDRAVKGAVAHALRDLNGAVDLLVLNAGFSQPGYFLDQDIDVFRRHMDVNYMGTVNVLKAALPSMVARRSGHVAIVSSAAGVLGMLGYASYCPTKWALRGLADALRQELLPTDVKVSICYPADVDTPGFKTENSTKPIETHEISATGSLMRPGDAASRILAGVRRGVYHVSTEPLSYLLVSAMSSMTPRVNFALELLLLPLVTIIQWVVTRQWDGIVRKHAAARPDIKRATA